MKNTMIILVSAVLLFSSCLKEENRAYATAETYYKNVAQIESGLNACYDPMRSIIGAGFFQMTECATDVMYLGSTTRSDANCVISPTKPGVGAAVWKQSYTAIMRANSILASIQRSLEKGYVTEEEVTPYIAEAIVMRAFYYYYLTSTFGDVPFYTWEVTEENRAKTVTLPRTPADDIRDYLITELMDWLMPADKEGKEALPLVRTYAKGYRAGAAVGLMLAGKFCMWNQEWDKALAVYGEIEDIYGHFVDAPEAFGEAYPLTDIPFNRKFAPESVWEVSNHIEDYGVQSWMTLACYCTPYRSDTDVEPDDDDETSAPEVVSDIYNGIVIPELGKYARTYAAARPTTYYYNQLMTYNGGDLRAGEYNKVDDPSKPRGGSGNLAWRWKGYEKTDLERKDLKVLWFSTTGGKGAGRPWLGNKFWCEDLIYNHDDNNYKVFRYAGALLNMAEAYCWLGDYDNCCKYLNIIRERAGVHSYRPSDFSGSDELLEAVREECARELYGEFQRKFDLVRWGIWYTRTCEYNNSAYIKDYIQPYHEYYPIPSDQVEYSGGALDNKEYTGR